MPYQLQFHIAIEKDYNEAYDWYETQQDGLGERFLIAVKNKLLQIGENPETFSSKNNRKYREAKVDIFPFVIVYKIYKQRNIIFINSIHHSKKHPQLKYRK